jgi:hypothetical protein
MIDAHFRCNFISTYSLVLPDMLMDIDLTSHMLQQGTVRNEHLHECSSALLPNFSLVLVTFAITGKVS